MKITYFGHSCFSIETQGKTLLVDPFITGNPLAAHVDIENIEADYILLTHGHGDHVGDLEAIGKRTKAFVISNYEIVSWAKGQFDFDGHGMNHGGKYSFDFGVLKYVTAQHSSTLPDGTGGGNPGGFVLWNAEACIYIAGDTALTYDMKLIPMTCPALDLAILPIGDNFTMGIDEAVIAADFIACDRIIGCHYNSFPTIKINAEAAIAAFAEAGKTLLLPAIDSSVNI